MQLVAQEDSGEQHAIEARVEHAQLPLSRPWVQGICSARAPHQQQVAHFKDGEHHKLEEGRHRKRVEHVLLHYPCMQPMPNTPSPSLPSQSCG